jgi:hypothetical protein
MAADSLDDADDLVADDGRERDGGPAAGDGVHVRATDAVVRDRDLDFGLLPLLGRLLDHAEVGPLLRVYEKEQLR